VSEWVKGEGRREKGEGRRIEEMRWIDWERERESKTKKK
jgi:hypothetical protein